MHVDLMWSETIGMLAGFSTAATYSNANLFLLFLPSLLNALSLWFSSVELPRRDSNPLCPKGTTMMHVDSPSWMRGWRTACKLSSPFYTLLLFLDMQVYHNMSCFFWCHITTTSFWLELPGWGMSIWKHWAFAVFSFLQLHHCSHSKESKLYIHTFTEY